MRVGEEGNAEYEAPPEVRQAPEMASAHSDRVARPCLLPTTAGRRPGTGCPAETRARRGANGRPRLTGQRPPRPALHPPDAAGRGRETPDAPPAEGGRRG